MTQDVIDYIRACQNEMTLPENDAPPVHEPQVLLIGCVDARLSIHKDIGFPDGSTLIYRNIAALVSGNEEGQGRISEAAALQFAVDVMKVKHIVVMGHTDCGGIRACLNEKDFEHTQAIRDYLKPLAGVREEVVARGGSEKEQRSAMEMAAVHNSLANLMTYPVVARAVEEGRLEIHGWVINTGTKEICELDKETGQFVSMRAGEDNRASLQKDGAVVQKSGFAASLRAAMRPKSSKEGGDVGNSLP